MGAGSAAATRPAAPLDHRLRRLLERADRMGESRLAARLLPTPGSRSDGAGPVSGAAGAGFYWLRIAEWLADSFDLRASGRGRRLFDDLCWIQYCVYGVFRAQDDLVDGDAGEPLLAVEANQLAVDAARCAARWFDGESAFWSLFQNAIERTTRALVALDGLQRRPRREAHAELGLYVDLGASLKIAAAGVALAAGRERDWRQRISPALDRLAVAGQILDDLDDVDADLGAGRLNYAAWWLSRPIVDESREAVRAVIAFSLATGDRLAGLIEVARRHVTEASAVLGPGVCPPMHRFLGLYRGWIDAVETGIDRRRDSLLAADPPAAGAAAPSAMS